MANFTVRVELHSVSDLNHPSYTKLHAAMEKGGFSRTVLGSSGKRYHLPRAEYDFSSDLTREEVRDKASAIANAVDQDHGVLVTKGDKCWVGLKEVKK